MIEIVGWKERYEVSAKGREPKASEDLRAGPLQFVRLKVHGHSQGAGYRRLKSVAGKRTLEVFGAFCKFLEIAGNQKREKRGALLNEKGQPATAEDLAFILDAPLEQINNALKVLSNEKVGWLSNNQENTTQPNTTQGAGNSRKFPEISGKDEDTVSQIFSHWNSHKCKDNDWRAHSELTPETQSAVKGVIRQGYSAEQIMAAIDNYARVLLDKELFVFVTSDRAWDKAWTLREFLSRGMKDDRTEKYFYRFLPDNFRLDEHLTNAAKEKRAAQAQGPVPLQVVRNGLQRQKRNQDAEKQTA